MKLRATAPKGNDTPVWICHEPFAQMDVWIDEIPNGTDTVKDFHEVAFYRWYDTEHVAVEMWAKIALKFRTPAPNGDPLPPFTLRAFVAAVQESLLHQDEENNWVTIPDVKIVF